jgi:hypothetical protein
MKLSNLGQTSIAIPDSKDIKGPTITMLMGM